MQIDKAFSLKIRKSFTSNFCGTDVKIVHTLSIFVELMQNVQALWALGR